MTRSEETSFTFEQARREFQHAWNNPDCTRFELPPVDVNATLRERYRTEPAAAMTLDQLWDMETKKAWDPSTYIPYAVSQGRSWGRHGLESGCERFFRASDQAAWIDGTRGLVIEDVSISHNEKRIFFLGRPKIIDDRGDIVDASAFQPLFHVEHAAEGTGDRPLNVWRIVVLTAHEDARFKRPFEDRVAAGYLPGFVEEYLRRDMGVSLERL